MADKAHRETDEKLNAIERHLARLYAEHEKEAIALLSSFFQHFSKDDKKMLKKYTNGDISKEEYQKWRKSKIYHSKHFSKLKKELSEYLFVLNQKAVNYINGQLSDIYLLNYNAAADIPNITGFDTIDKPSEKAEENLPYKELKKNKDVQWNSKKIDALVLFGLSQLSPLEEIQSRARAIVRTNQRASVTYAGTMVTGAENLGRHNSYEEIQRIVGDGRRVRKRWHTVGDDRVRHAHRQMDGIDVPLGAAFVNSAGVIMQPGDRNATPQNVYNCRCWIEIVIRDIGTS